MMRAPDDDNLYMQVWAKQKVDSIGASALPWLWAAVYIIAFFAIITWLGS